MAQKIPNIQFLIVDAITKDVVGDLEIADATNFPIALTYTIKDIQDPESSKGSFSKTFQLPATKKNNTTLKNLYSDSLYNAFQYIEGNDAQIYVDGLLVLEGKFQIKGTVYKGVPQSYDAVVFGDNYRWVNALSELNMCEVDFDSADLFPLAPKIAEFSKDAMEKTWYFPKAGDTVNGEQTHIVYPLINTGKWNNVGTSGYAWVSPSDMTPSFFLYNLIKVIFGAQGYTVESTFMETDWFKKQISVLPKQEFVNSDELVELFSFEYESDSQTNYKQPSQYNTNPSYNFFHGAIINLVLTCPTCDPSNLITTQTHTPHFDVITPAGINNMIKTEMPTVAGWFWGAYGLRNDCEARLPYYESNPCGSGNTYVGHNWGCVLEDMIGTATPYTQQITIDAFQTPFLGQYVFNGKVRVEMDNDYALNSNICNLDPGGQPGVPSGWNCGTGEGGSQMQCSQSIMGEVFYGGLTYVANLYLVHHRESTGRDHVVVVDSQRLDAQSIPNYGSYNTTWPYLFCNNYQLPPTLVPPSTDVYNLIFDLDFDNVTLDILGVNDKVYLYTEVTAEWQSYSTAIGGQDGGAVTLTQMKYRVKNSAFSGNLSPGLVSGGSVDLAKLLPCDISQLDFITGLTGVYNLMWESDENSKVVKVEPRDGFFTDPNNAVSWTEKLDKSQPEKNEFVYDALKRNLCFTYEDDGQDAFVEERNRRKGQKCALGSHPLNLGDLYVNEEQKIGTNFYSPTYMFYDKTISNFQNDYRQPFIPVIHSEYTAIWNATNNNNLPPKIEEFAPRILIWYGNQPLNQNNPNSFTWRWGEDGDQTSVEHRIRYPFAGTYSDQDMTLAGDCEVGTFVYPRPTMYYEENTQENATNNPPPYNVGNGLYEMFWERMILGLIDRPKIKKAFFKLTPLDIANLNFRRLIHIRGEQSDTYYILNKIVDYKPGLNVLTQVELFEFHNYKPLKSNFFTLDKGFGEPNNPSSDDFIPVLVSGGKVKTPNLDNQLGIYDIQKKPFVDKGVSAYGSATKSWFEENVNYQPKTYFCNGVNMPTTNGQIKSYNVGGQTVQNNGNTSLGKNIQSNNTNSIIIGDGNVPNSNHKIQFGVGGQTALAISSTGEILEGGGGVIYYEDATTGKVEHVITGVPNYSVTTKQLTYTYAKCLMCEEYK